MGLKDYKRKRNFDRTPEPAGRARRAVRHEPIFVVQKHAASHLHYDFRLEHDGVLWSWAVPKGPSLNPAHKRLAIHVEDHPVEYAGFEGIIPKGEYGGGTVMLWDRGTWTAPESPAQALRRGKLTFTLHGRRLRGEWTLARIRGKKDEADDREQWLLIKGDDDEASRKGAVTESFDTSVETGRSMDQIASDADAQWNSNKGISSKNGRTTTKSRGGSRRTSTSSKRKKVSTSDVDASAVPGARKAAMPRDPSPQLCMLADHVPEGDEWIHEIKFDGYRFLAMIRRSEVTLLSRNAHDWTSRFRVLVEPLQALPVESAILDGEACIVDPQGTTSFQRLQNSIKAQKFDRLAFFAFDLLYLDGYDLTASPLIQRKAALRAVIPDDLPMIRFSDHIEGRGRQVERRACALDLEGVICKRADALYEQRRAPTWLKVKCSKRQEFIVIGWTAPSGARKHFGSLLLGAHDADGRLRYTGRVGTGFNAASLRDIAGRLKKLARKSCPADVPPDPSERRGARWVTPELVAEVEFTQWTDEGRLRHPSFQGLREDKDPKAVRIERPAPVEDLEMAAQAPVHRSATNGTPKGRSGRKRAEVDKSVEVSGVQLSNADRVLFPEPGATKLDLARYYATVADRILPYLIDRPLSTVRCPRGRGGECFFQKHLGETLSDPVRAIRVREKDGSQADYIAVDSVEGLITLVQFGVLEFHPWGSTQQALESPDTLTFDLDPGEGVAFDAIKDAAIEVRDALESLGLKPYLKASGGKGLHVVVPIKPDSDWDRAKRFCEAFAKAMAAQDPGRYVAVASKAQRKGRIFIDYLRNSRGATSIAPYSTRARPGAPVAVPLRWDELARLKSANQYDIGSLPRRLRGLKKDPWARFRADERSLPDIRT